MSSCPICCEEYTWDTSAVDKRGLPVQSQKCAHVFCYNCILILDQRREQQSAGSTLARPQGAQRSRSTGGGLFRRINNHHHNRRDSHTTGTTATPENYCVQCPVCRTPDAFNIYQPIFSLVTCELLEERHAQAKNNDSVSEGSNSHLHTTTSDYAAAPGSPVGGSESFVGGSANTIHGGSVTGAGPSGMGTFGGVPPQNNNNGSPVVVQATPLVGAPPPGVVMATAVTTPTSCGTPTSACGSPTATNTNTADTACNGTGTGSGRSRVPSIFVAPTGNRLHQSQRERFATARSHSPSQDRPSRSSRSPIRHSYCPPSGTLNAFQQQQQRFSLSSTSAALRPQLQPHQRSSYRVPQTQQPVQQHQQRQQQPYDPNSLSGASFHGHDALSNHQHQRHRQSSQNNYQQQPHQQHTPPQPRLYGAPNFEADQIKYREMQQKQKNDMSIPSIFRPP